MRRLVAGLAIVLVWPSFMLAQAPDWSMERISLALERPPLFTMGRPEDAPKPPPRLGIFTLVPPTGRGEIIKISVPIGALVSKALKSVSAANQRRREAAARRNVEAALEAFLEQQQPRDR